MRTRTFVRRGVLPLSCLALLTIWTQVGHPQPQPVPGQVPPLPQADLPPVAPAASPGPFVPPWTCRPRPPA